MFKKINEAYHKIIDGEGINETEDLNLYNNKFIFQSHIAGDWNDNVWNNDNYENFRNILCGLYIK